MTKQYHELIVKFADDPVVKTMSNGYPCAFASGLDQNNCYRRIAAFRDAAIKLGRFEKGETAILTGFFQKHENFPEQFVISRAERPQLQPQQQPLQKASGAMLSTISGEVVSKNIYRKIDKMKLYNVMTIVTPRGEYFEIAVTGAGVRTISKFKKGDIISLSGCCHIQYPNRFIATGILLGLDITANAVAA